MDKQILYMSEFADGDGIMRYEIDDAVWNATSELRKRSSEAKVSNVAVYYTTDPDELLGIIYGDNWVKEWEYEKVREEVDDWSWGDAKQIMLDYIDKAYEEKE